MIGIDELIPAGGAGRPANVNSDALPMRKSVQSVNWNNVRRIGITPPELSAGGGG
jgi:hypothetical protein